MTATPTILIVVGSTRQGSFNHALADEAAKALEGKANARFLDYTDVPFYEQGIEFPAPEAVARVRGEVEAADAVWFFTPEYNFSYPGLLKNLIDWLSRPLDPTFQDMTTAIAGKKVAIASATGKSAGAGVQAKLSELLGFVKAEVLDEPKVGVVLPAEAFMTGAYAPSDEDKAAVAAQAEALLAFIAR